ncbi:hypothetical protein R84B8_02785 [Treponema sp. R8-4-B8]
MRKNFLISLAILIGMVIFITACGDLAVSDYGGGEDEDNLNCTENYIDTPWKKAFRANVSSLSTTLTANTWADGNLTANGWKWFKFTAIASTQYIHVSFGTMNSNNNYGGLNVRVYDSTGKTIGRGFYSYRSGSKSKYISRSITSGQVYYIKVSSYSYRGTYRIAFNESFVPPATTLTANTWTDGNLSNGGEQWFEFTATASTQYIHVSLGTLSYLYVQVYDSNHNTVVSQINLYRYTSMSVTSGQVYYIKVTPYNPDYYYDYYRDSNSGTYRIAFNDSIIPPDATVTMLTADTWSDGNLSANGEQWFEFTATASTQYIHAAFGTLTNLYVQLYDSTGNTGGDQTNLSNNNNDRRYISRSVTSGQVYYIRVTPYSSSGSGTYRIAFNSTTAPPNFSPLSTMLTANTWADGDLSVNGEQWFKFTATANNQYIHASFGTLTDLYVQAYDSTGNGNTVGNWTNLYDKYYGSNRRISLLVTSGQVYYIRVTSDSSNSGTYRIAFNTSTTPPS